MTASRFDQLFLKPPQELFFGMVARIQDHTWAPSRIRDLPAPHATIVRVSWYRVIFGNGGLQYWFESDSPNYGPSTSDALRDIGLPDSADALADAYGLFETPRDYEDWDRRMECLRVRADDFNSCDARLWTEFAKIDDAAGAFVVRNRHAFEVLRDHLPYDPSSKTYGDSLE